MTIALNDRLDGPYVCTGGETLLPFAFPTIALSDVVVRRTRAEVEATLTYGADYTLTGIGTPGGNVVLLVAAQNGDQYIVAGARAAARTSELSQDRSYPAAVLNAEYDHLEVQIQELRRDVSRSLRRSLFDTSAASGELPPGGSGVVVLNPDGSVDLDEGVATSLDAAVAAAGQAEDSAAIAVDRAAAAAASATAAAAAASATGPFVIYPTKAAADAALAGLPANQWIEVEVDETRANRRTRYQKSGGVYVFAIYVATEYGPDGVARYMGMTAGPISTERLVEFGNAHASFPAELRGKGRTWFDIYGAFFTQAWTIVSGIFKTLADGRIDLIDPGCTYDQNHHVVVNSINGGGGAMSGWSNDVHGGNRLSQDNQLTNNDGANGFKTLGRPVIAVAGTGYTAGDVLTVSGGTAIAETAAVYRGASSDFGRGTGYVAGEVVTLGGGDGTVAATVTVDSVDGAGRVVTAHISNAGTYDVYPIPNVDLLQASTTGVGVNFRPYIEFPKKGAAKIVVDSVNTSGAITGFTVVRPGWYSVAPAATAALTGGTGTGATLTGRWNQRAATSVHDTFLDANFVIRKRIYVDGTARYGYAEHVEGFETSNVAFGPMDVDGFGRLTTRTLGTDGRLKADEGFRAPVAAESILGNTSTLSLVRSLTATAGDTVELGTLSLSDGSVSARLMSLQITTENGVRAYMVPLIWAAGQPLGALGVSSAGVWVEVAPLVDLTQAGSRPYALDAKQDGATGAVALRLRVLAGSGGAQTAYIGLTFTGRNLEGKWSPSTATASGVAAPTRLYYSQPPALRRRTKVRLEVATTGAAFTLLDNEPVLQLEPSGTIATCAVVLPPNPIDGQEHQIASTQQITALTVTCVGAAVRSGAGILLAAGDSYTWRYYAANFGWYRVRT